MEYIVKYGNFLELPVSYSFKSNFVRTSEHESICLMSKIPLEKNILDF